MTSIEKIDTVLTWLANRHSGGDTSIDIYKGVLIEHPEFETIAKFTELGEMLDKLYKDGYVGKRDIKLNKGKDNEDDKREYWATFDGKFFNENGGYSVKLQDDNLARNHAEQVEKAMLVNNKWIMRGSWGAAIAASLYLLWCIFAYGLDHHWWCFCWLR